MRWRRTVLIAVTACHSSAPPQPGPPSHVANGPKPDAAVDAAPAYCDARDLAYSEAERARANRHFAEPDSAPGPRLRRDTAVLLISPAYALSSFDDGGDQTGPRRFQAVVCAIHGKLETGLPCARLMPARATIRTPNGPLTVARSRKAFIDPMREDDHGEWPAPFGPSCCHYNGCVGNTIPYTADPGASVADYPATVFGVWPADADIDLQVAAVGNRGVAASDLPPSSLLPPPRCEPWHVRQAFVRGARRIATFEGMFSGPVTWNAGAGWIRAQTETMDRGDTVIATSDVDGDGHLELVSYEDWVNNYGLEVFVDRDAKPIYSFSCGGI